MKKMKDEYITSGGFQFDSANPFIIHHSFWSRLIGFLKRVFGV